MLKLKLQHFGHLMRRAGWDEDEDGWMASPTQWTWVWVDSGSWWWTGRSGMLQFMGSQRVRHDWATELNWTAPWKKGYDKPMQYIEKQRCYFADKRLSSQSYGFSSSHVQMWELDNKESWALKDWCFWTVVLEKTLESPLDFKEIKLAHSKGKQSWIFTGKIYAEAKTPILWPPGMKN